MCVCVLQCNSLPLSHHGKPHIYIFRGGSVVKNYTAIHKTQVRSLGWEDPLKEGMAVFLLRESHGQRSLVGCSP